MSAPTRECRACGGTGAHGGARYAKTAAENSGRGRRMRVALRIEARRYPCPVCAGSGRVDAKASRADAMADAETLREPGIGLGPIRTDLDAGTFAAIVGSPDDAERLTREAARVAFRAVPGLRGE